MTVAQIEQRVAALEVEVTRLKEKLEAVTKPAQPWWQEIYGTFADDPLHEEAMQAGREYRESLRPKAPKRPKGNQANERSDQMFFVLDTDHMSALEWGWRRCRANPDFAFEHAAGRRGGNHHHHI